MDLVVDHTGLITGIRMGFVGDVGGASATLYCCLAAGQLPLAVELELHRLWLGGIRQHVGTLSDGDTLTWLSVMTTARPR